MYWFRFQLTLLSFIWREEIQGRTFPWFHSVSFLILRSSSFLNVGHYLHLGSLSLIKVTVNTNEGTRILFSDNSLLSFTPSNYLDYDWTGVCFSVYIWSKCLSKLPYLNFRKFLLSMKVTISHIYRCWGSKSHWRRKKIWNHMRRIIFTHLSFGYGTTIVSLITRHNVSFTLSQV